ncbi:hypothetical protein [Simiduia aestuariiviva]|uniref:Uncharacterized protein n=1 Tax=Simiduia aestuariiviva TaxID=1510459 RepID=A0A839UPZ6_9GAMM|nr:hypothetical protein [Simiduia aestuariiviva]MBB3169922.1 hypothetical protein [Simiduia aestuariiviva]
MKTAFLLQNQNKLLLNKQREWVDATDLKSLYLTPHKDEAINQKVEVNAKDYTQRIHLLECPLNEKGLPQVPEDALPEPLPKAERTTEQSSLLVETADDGDNTDALSSSAESADPTPDASQTETTLAP